MNLHSSIEATIEILLNRNGVEVTNETEKKSFLALVTSADFIAEFTIADQDTEEGIQAVVKANNLPKTGHIVTIGNRRYKVNKIQSRVGSPIGRFYAELKKQKR